MNLNFVILETERTAREAASAKFDAARRAAAHIARTEIVEATTREARETVALAAITAKGALATSVAAVMTVACATTTVSQPVVGTITALWGGIKAGWKA